MSKEVQIGNTIYKIPIYGENRWGENTTALLEAMSEALSNLVGPQDILTREANLSNNVTIPAPVNGMKFDNSIVQSSTVEGVIVRTFTEVSGKEPTQDRFSIQSCSFQGAMEYAVTYVGTDAKVKLIGQDSGQFLYTSEDVPDTEAIFVKYFGKAIVEDQI